MTSPNGLPVVYVGRPSVWQNRYAIGTHSNTLGRAVANNEEAVQLYRDIIWASPDAPHMTAYVKERLRGKNLCCWCKLDQVCHGDVLLEIAAS